MNLTLSPASSSAASLLPIGHKGPRGEVLCQLKQGQPLAARDLAARLGTSLNAVRHHLKELEAESLVTYERENRGVGAPVYLYRLSPAGEELFPRSFEDALNVLLDQLVRREGRDGAIRHLEEYFGPVTRQLGADPVLTSDGVAEECHERARSAEELP